jgi:hypothetical protein
MTTSSTIETGGTVALFDLSGAKRLSRPFKIGLAATVSGLLLSWAVHEPLAEGFSSGGRIVLAEKLATLGARVEDYVPEEGSKIAKPVAGAFLGGVVGVVGEKIGKVFVGGSWPVVQAWFDRRIHTTDQMIWAGPLNIVHGRLVGRDDTVSR